MSIFDRFMIIRDDDFFHMIMNGMWPHNLHVWREII